MSDSHVSGRCLYRMLCKTMSVYELLALLYENVLDPDKFYSTVERKEIMNTFLRKRGLCDKYTEKHLEEALEKEMRYRDKSPVPRGYHERSPQNPGTFLSNPQSRVILGEYPGNTYYGFLQLFFSRSVLNYISMKELIDIHKMYDVSLFHRLGRHLDRLVRHDETVPSLIKAFQKFLEIEDLMSIVGTDISVKMVSQHYEHNYINTSKAGRLREEIVQAQSQSPPYVVHFLAIVSDRVFTEYYAYESAHFEKRMVLLDCLQQLPTGTKAKGNPKHSFITINQKDQYEINQSALEKVYPHIKMGMDSKKGKPFAKSFTDHMQKTFPGRTDGKPTKAALLFAEKFFSWGASTLEFDRGLVEPLKSMYTFGAMPTNKKIALRVYHMPNQDPTRKIGAYVFVEDIRHALRVYENNFGPIEFEIRRPNRPGPATVFHEITPVVFCEEELQRITGNRIVFEPVPIPQIELFGFELFPIPGPYNRHVTCPAPILDNVISILVDEVKLGINLDPKHPQTIGVAVAILESFPRAHEMCLVDIIETLNLRWFASGLDVYMKKSPTRAKVLQIQLKVMKQLELFDFPYELKTQMLKRIQVVTCFPKLGPLIHEYFCKGEFCHLSPFPNFQGFYGPNEQKFKTLPYPVKCITSQSVVQIPEPLQKLLM